MNPTIKTEITYKKWLTPDPKAVLLLVHGLGAHMRRWDLLANFFLQQNISSYALELRGFGETKDLKGHIDSFDLYLEDILSLYQIIRQENPAKNVIIVGESLGALLAILVAAANPQLFKGLICISPVFKDKLRFALVNRLRIYSAILCSPRRQFSVPFNSQMCTRDTVYQKAMDQDPREHRLASARLLFETLRAQQRTKFLLPGIRIPILFLLAGEDLLVAPQAARKIFQKLKNKDKSIIEYPEMYHSLSIDLGKEKVFADILSWIKERIILG